MSYQHDMTNTQMPGQPVQYEPAKPMQMPVQSIQYQPVQLQPMNVEHHHGGHSGSPKPWNSGLFGCFSDIGICCMTTWCPCVQYGENYEAIHNKGCCSQGTAWFCLSYFWCCCLIHKDLRSDIRQKYGLEEDFGDCVTTSFCSACAICQEAREIKSREGH